MQVIDLWLNDPDKPHSSVLLEAIYAARKSQETADAIYEQYKSTAVPENYVLVYGYCKALSARVATEY